MSFTQRMMGYVTFLVLRLSFWGALALGIAMVYQRGLERSVGDAVAVGKMVVRKWGEESKNYNNGNQAGKGRW